jgi:hypothetical protein
MRTEIDQLRAENTKLQRAWVKEQQPVDGERVESDDGISQTGDLEYDELDLLSDGKRRHGILSRLGWSLLRT